MRYTINIESAAWSNNFRLTSEREWTRCNDSSLLSPNDYWTTSIADIIGRQERDITIEIDGEEFEIDPDSGTDFGNENQLHYRVYGFRQEYPNPPDENQLLRVLFNGDDSVRNILVLQTDGLFYLLRQDQILDDIVNPSYIVKCEAFQPGNGFVGPTIADNNIRNYVQNLFKMAVSHWVSHLRDKELHDAMEIILQEGNQVPEIVDLFEELEQIKENWTPDY
jgi:hypothetical protein